MNHGPFGSSQHFSYQQGGYPQGGYPPQPGYSPYNVPPPGWNSPANQLADLGPRILAYLIDGFLISAIAGIGYIIAAVVFGVLAGTAGNSDAGQAAASLFVVVILVIILPLSLAIWLFDMVYMAGKNNGQTIGKKLMKIRIVKEEGGNFGYMDAFLRNIVGYWISGLVCSLGFIWGLFDNRRQTWHDKIFHTIVVKAE